ncbi:hypothetical protein ACLKA6_018805 [Drosophila palustris]
MDETWIHYYIPESNRSSAEWREAGESRSKRVKASRWAGRQPTQRRTPTPTREGSMFATAYTSGTGYSSAAQDTATEDGRVTFTGPTTPTRPPSAIGLELSPETLEMLERFTRFETAALGDRPEDFLTAGVEPGAPYGSWEIVPPPTVSLERRPAAPGPDHSDISSDDEAREIPPRPWRPATEGTSGDLEDRRCELARLDTDTNKRSYFGARVILSSVGDNPGKNPATYLWYLLTVVFGRGIDPVGRGKNPLPVVLCRTRGRRNTGAYTLCRSPAELPHITRCVLYVVFSFLANISLRPWQTESAPRLEIPLQVAPEQGRWRLKGAWHESGIKPHNYTQLRVSQRIREWASAGFTSGEELMAIALEFGLSSEGLLEDLRTCAFIQTGSHSPAALEAQRPKTLEPPAESGEPRSGGHSRRASESDLRDAQVARHHDLGA